MFHQNPKPILGEDFHGRSSKTFHALVQTDKAHEMDDSLNENNSLTSDKNKQFALNYFATNPLPDKTYFSLKHLVEDTDTPFLTTEANAFYIQFKKPFLTHQLSQNDIVACYPASLKTSILQLLITTKTPSEFYETFLEFFSFNPEDESLGQFWTLTPLHLRSALLSDISLFGNQCQLRFESIPRNTAPSLDTIKREAQFIISTLENIKTLVSRERISSNPRNNQLQNKFVIDIADLQDGLQKGLLQLLTLEEKPEPAISLKK